MLSDEREDVLSIIQNSRERIRLSDKYSQQKEHDWALHGGIASGIAGPAAGLAVAADIQAENERIRAENAINAELLAPIIQNSKDAIKQYRKYVKALEKEIEEAKIKLVSTDDAETCLSKISFSNTEVEVSETGTCTVTTSAKLASPMFIYDNVEATIDGTIIANIYDEKTLIGSALLVLPKFGVEQETELRGMCLYCGTEGKTYTVEFTATNLWAIEK